VKNPYSVIKDFEEGLAEYTGARFVVCVNSCTAAIQLAVQYALAESLIDVVEDVRPINRLSIPKRTYCSVPMAIIRAGGNGYIVRASGGQYTTAGGVSLDWVNSNPISMRGVGRDLKPASMAAGVLRRLVGGVWAWISDPNHSFTGFSGTVTVSGNQIILTPDPGVTHNWAAMVVPDETFAQMGMCVGFSSGVGPGAQTKISMGMPLSLKFTATNTPAIVAGNAYHTDNPATKAHWALASYTLTGITGTVAVGDEVVSGGITCKVTYFSGTRMDVEGKNSATDRYAPLPASGAVTGPGGFSATISARTMVKGWCVFHLTSWTNNEPVFSYNPSNYPALEVGIMSRRFSATEDRAHPVGILATRIYYNGTAWATADGNDRDNNGGNAWTMTWNGGAGRLEVTHPEVMDALAFSTESYGSTVLVDRTFSAITTTGFHVYFKNPDGTAVTTESTSMSLSVNRGKFQLYKPWTGHITLNQAAVTVDPAYVENDNANLWVMVLTADSPGIIA